MGVKAVEQPPRRGELQALLVALEPSTHPCCESAACGQRVEDLEVEVFRRRTRYDNRAIRLSYEVVRDGLVADMSDT